MPGCFVCAETESQGAHSRVRAVAGVLPRNGTYLVFIRFSSAASGTLALDYSLHPQLLKNV